jgi:hypothetical protein
LAWYGIISIEVRKHDEREGDKMKRNMGSVSQGTMRVEDLIPVFLRELESQKPLLRKHWKLCREIRSGMGVKGYYEEGGNSAWDLESLFDALDEYASAYFFFGAHPCDGADYGWWLSDGFQEEFQGLQVSDLSEVPKGYRGEVLHVNDHGNMTLYAYHVNHKYTELWAIV